MYTNTVRRYKTTYENRHVEFTKCYLLLTGRTHARTHALQIYWPSTTESRVKVALCWYCCTAKCRYTAGVYLMAPAVSDVPRLKKMRVTCTVWRYIKKLYLRDQYVKHHIQRLRPWTTFKMVPQNVFTVTNWTVRRVSKLRIATASLGTSVLPNEQLGSRWTNFRKFFTIGFYNTHRKRNFGYNLTRVTKCLWTRMATEVTRITTVTARSRC